MVLVYGRKTGYLSTCATDFFSEEGKIVGSEAETTSRSLYREMVELSSEISKGQGVAGNAGQGRPYNLVLWKLHPICPPLDETLDWEYVDGVLDSVSTGAGRRGQSKFECGFQERCSSSISFNYTLFSRRWCLRKLFLYGWVIPFLVMVVKVLLF